MSKSSRRWLDRLLKVTNYRELREIFQELQQEAKETADRPSLVAAIEEGIRRIDYETKRDETEMQSRREAYDAFLANQRGCLGWLRRALPWTATSRAEREHQSLVAEQRQEILANQLIVARAQMLQEGLRDPAERRIGPPRDVWEKKLAEFRGAADLPQVAAQFRALAHEVVQGEAFLAELSRRVEEFARTEMPKSEYRQWRDADVAEARRQWQQLGADVEAKQLLCTHWAERIGQWVNDDLATHHAGFRQMQVELKALDQQLAAGQMVRKAVQDLGEQLKRFHAAIQCLAQSPQRRMALQQQFNEFQDQWNKRTQAARRLQQDASGLQDRMNRAARDAAQLESALRTAEKMFHAYLAERRIVEMPPAGDPIYASPLATEYQRLQREWQHSQQQLKMVQREYQESQQRLQRAVDEGQQSKQQMEMVQQQIQELDQQYQRAQQDIESYRRDLPRWRLRWDDQASALVRLDTSRFLQVDEAIRAVRARWQSWSSPWGVAMHGSPNGDEREVNNTLTEVGRLAETLDRTLRELQQHQVSLHGQVQRLRAERLTELLGEDLVERLKSTFGFSAGQSPVMAPHDGTSD